MAQIMSIILDYEHNLSNDVFLTYLQNSQISPNSSKFCSFLAKSERFKRLQTDEDGRTHSSNLRLSYTKSPFGAIKVNSAMKHVLIYKKYIKIRKNTKNTKKLRMMVAVLQICPKKHVFEKICSKLSRFPRFKRVVCFYVLKFSKISYYFQ